MAVKYFSSIGSRTSVNINSPIQKASITNDSAARKFITPPAPVSDGVSISNVEHTVGMAAGLKSLAINIEKIGESTRASLLSVRAVMDAQDSDQVNQNKALRFSAQDLEVAQGAISRDVLSRLGDLGALTRVSSTAWELVSKTFHGVSTTKNDTHVDLTNTAVPDIDHVSIDIDKKKGSIDCFYTTVTFSIPLAKVQDEKIKAIRIMRSTAIGQFLRGSGRLSTRGMELLRADKSRSRSKNQDYLSFFDLKLRENGVDNSVSALNSFDSTTGVRLSSDSNVKRNDFSSVSMPVGDDRIAIDLASFFNSTSAFSQLDFSVAQDPKTIQNLLRANPALANRLNVDTISSGRLTFVDSSGRIGSQALNQVRNAFAVQNQLTVGNQAAQQFKEIAFIKPDDPRKVRERIVGNLIEYTFDDPTVEYGNSYSYYVVTVDDNMNESARSRIVQANIDGFRVPENPKRVNTHVIDGSVALTIIVDDLLVEKFEIFRKEEGAVKNDDTVDINVISGKGGYPVERAQRKRLGNGFLQIGESLNDSKAGSSFYDRFIKRGIKYIYRVYSVDVFGNKSESPKEIEVFVPDLSAKKIDLKKPSMTAEVDAKTGKIRLTITADDERVKGLYIGRRDLTIKQKAFVGPAEPNAIKFGNTSAFGSAHHLDPRIVDNENTWTGFIERPIGTAVFIDPNVSIDHTYQYRVYGIDRFANETPYEITSPIFVVNRAFINEPVNVFGTVLADTRGRPAGIRITWDDGNVDISAEDRVGSRDTLADSSVRTLYQVERKKIGENIWKEFPLVENRLFEDVVDPGSQGVNNPGFRPDYLQANSSYVYRIAAYQTGSFISNFSAQIELTVTVPVLSPNNFKINTPSTKQRPYYVVLNWDTNNLSGEVDRWEIERAEVNNFAAQRLNLSNQADFDSLSFNPYRRVYLESSRFRERTDDETSDILDSGSFIASLTTGQHHYLDQSISFGNTYIYRIRAVASTGEAFSGWVHRGVKITDDVFEKKQEVIINQTEKNELTITPVPTVLKNNFLETDVLTKLSSYSLVPSYVQTIAATVPPPPVSKVTDYVQPQPTSLTSLITQVAATLAIQEPTVSVATIAAALPEPTLSTQTLAASTIISSAEAAVISPSVTTLLAPTATVYPITTSVVTIAPISKVTSLATRYRG